MLLKINVYVNLMTFINQNSIIYTVKIKGSKHSNRDSYQITREENKRRDKKEQPPD